MTDPTVIDLLSDVDAYLCALHVHGARHDQIGADLTCGGCVLRDRIAAALPQLAAVPPASQTTDRAALRQRIAEVLTGAYLTAPDDSAIMEALADAVLAVLPEPVDRAAILTEAADALDAYITRYRSPSIANWTGAVAFLRRLAAEAQPTTRPETNLADRLEAVLTERFTELGNPFSRMSYQEKGPDGWPASHPVGPHHVAEVLRELLAAGVRQDGAAQ